MQLLLLLCLAAQDQSAEAKKLLNALAPPLKDPAHSQIEWTIGSRTAVGYFERQKAWRLDTKSGDVEMVFLWDGKSFLNYMKRSNRFFNSPKEPVTMLLIEGGGLAEIHYSGNADRLLKDAKQVTVKKEKLDEVDCSHVVITPKDLQGSTDVELHFWIADGACKRFSYKSKPNGKPNERTYTYKVVDPPSVTEETFAFKPPADAKDMRAGNK
ncbi:MAG TPA: DUF2092 domain-containing protein [Planctomycetota bacterium]|jgi:hypothetical protein|nr:DUF2092 domain-containing protein [Planctomycetota bacterium]